MNAQEHIRNAFGRMAHVFAKRPEAARASSVMPTLKATTRPAVNTP